MNFQINREDIKKLMESAKKERKSLGKIIYPILERYELKKIEVCQIGKFVQKIDAEIQIFDKPKPPNLDFIIDYNQRLIGLEHTQILTESASGYFKNNNIIRLR